MHAANGKPFLLCLAPCVCALPPLTLPVCLFQFERAFSSCVDDTLTLLMELQTASSRAQARRLRGAPHPPCPTPCSPQPQSPHPQPGHLPCRRRPSHMHQPSPSVHMRCCLARANLCNQQSAISTTQHQPISTSQSAPAAIHPSPAPVCPRGAVAHVRTLTTATTTRAHSHNRPRTRQATRL